MMTYKQAMRIRDVYAHCPIAIKRGDSILVRLGYLAREDYRLGEAMPGNKPFYDENGGIIPKYGNPT